MKFEKPGPKKKTSKIKNKSPRLHDIKKPPEGTPCVRCDKPTNTERFAHYEGFRKHMLGKGTGLKVNDNMTAFLCQKCTDIMDHKPGKYQFSTNVQNIDNERSIVKHSEEWLYLICKTHLL